MKLTAEDLDQGDQYVKFSDFYQFIEQLGSGSFAKVVRAVNLATQEQVAVKIITKRQVKGNDVSKLLQEAQILGQMNHPNIVKFRDVKLTDSKILIEMELVKFGQLRQLFHLYKSQKKWFTVAQMRQIVKCIFDAVAYVHLKGIVHRDLKPGQVSLYQNILVDDPEDLSSIKIADFGLSSSFCQVPVLQGQCGTLIYMAPEFFSSPVYSKPVDIWSCAMILYILCSGGVHPLYQKEDTIECYHQKLECINWNYPADFPSLAKSLFEKCVCIEPSERYTAHQILQHPWITGKQDDEIPLTNLEMFQSFKNSEKVTRLIKSIVLLCEFKRQAGLLEKMTKSYLYQCDEINMLEAKNLKRFRKTDALLDISYLQDLGVKQYSLSVQQIVKYYIKNNLYQQSSNNQQKLSKYEQFLSKIKLNQQKQYESIEQNVQETQEQNTASVTIMNSSIKQKEKSELVQKSILIRNIKKKTKKQKSIKYQQATEEKSALMLKKDTDLKERSKSTNQENKKIIHESPAKPRRPSFIIKQKQIGSSSQESDGQTKITIRKQQIRDLSLDNHMIEEINSIRNHEKKNSQRRLSILENSNFNELYDSQSNRKLYFIDFLIEIINNVFIPRVNRKHYQAQWQKNGLAGLFQNLPQERVQLQPTILDLNEFKVAQEMKISQNQSQAFEFGNNDKIQRIHDLTYITKPKEKPPLPKQQQKQIESQKPNNVYLNKFKLG